jgi:hypothetical protein
MSEINIEEVYAQLNVAKIMVATLQKIGEISLPVTDFLNATNEDKELQVDYNDEDKTFVFKLRVKDIIDE